MPRARPIKRLTPAELHALAVNVVTGKTYIGNSEHAYKESFGMLLMFFGGNPEELKNVGALYEDYANAGPRAINGRPWFTSCKMLNRKDLKPLMDEMDRVRKSLYPDGAEA